jgi:leucine dehydrogenase
VEIFRLMADHGHEQLAFCRDPVSGLRAIIGIHDTTLGPGLGGTRMWPYGSEEEAIIDVLRLSQGMTYKNAAMGLNFGGGKAVIIGDPRRDKSEALFRAFGKFVHSLGGRYVTAEDVGITAADMAIVRVETPYVCGLAETSGDPSPATAFGVYRGMKACALRVFGSESLRGRTVAVQGMGHVGTALARHLHDEGVHLVVADVFPDRVEAARTAFGATVVEADRIYDVECDIFAPCALGAVINDQTVERLRCKIVAGAANNQLATPAHGELLHRRGILYAPDFVINGGGVTNVADEFGPGGYQRERAYARVAQIYDKLLRVFAVCDRDRVLPHEAANIMAEERLETIARLKRMYVPGRLGGSGL